MSDFQYEHWCVDVLEATGRITWEVKAKSKDNAIRQIKKLAKEYESDIQKYREDYQTEIFWETLTLDRTGYNRRF